MRDRSGSIEAEEDVRATYANSGYLEDWCPSPESLVIDTNLCLEPCADDEGALRGASDDQIIVVGSACGDQRTNYFR